MVLLDKGIKQVCILGVEVSISSDTTATINNCNITGNVQEYLVSLYSSKRNQFVEDIHINLVMYPMTQPF